MCMRNLHTKVQCELRFNCCGSSGLPLGIIIDNYKRRLINTRGVTAFRPEHVQMATAGDRDVFKKVGYVVSYNNTGTYSIYNKKVTHDGMSRHDSSTSSTDSCRSPPSPHEVRFDTFPGAGKKC